MPKYRLLLLICTLFITSITTWGISEVTTSRPSGDPVIVNDEGGPVLLTGNVTYTNPFFTTGVSQPLIILEDQAGFVDRNEYFLFPPQSQVLGQITSDFFTSPFTYSLSLPIEPQGSLRDVDNDGEQDTGVMVFAVAYWTNKFGDPFLEERDMYGGGWSGAYASTRISSNPDTRLEVIGGKYLIYATDHHQGFPSGFGDDGLLFTPDDPIVSIPQGYSVVDMDVTPFTFNRARQQTIDLIEPETAAVVDYSNLNYADAFDAMLDLLSREYAFTEYRAIDWDALGTEYRPRFEFAQQRSDRTAYALALRDFLAEIPDGHVGMDPLLGILGQQFQQETDGGIGIAIRELDDERVLVNYLLEGSPAARAGMQLRTEILEINGEPITQVLDTTYIWGNTALGTDHTKRLQQLRYATRFEVGETIEITFRNPDGETQTQTLTAVPERASFAFSSFNAGRSGIELPVEFRILPSGYGYVSIYSFSDDEFLTVQLWERMIETFNAAEVPGIIVDMRNNGGGSGFLADQLSAYFFNEPLEVGMAGSYNDDLGEFYFDPRGVDRLYLPPDEYRFLGPVAVLIAPSCFSACEFFTYNLTINNRAEIIGFYPTGGLGGGVNDFYMPEGITVRFTASRAVDMNGEIHIEGKGVIPTRRVPVTEETLFSTGDPLLETAIETLTQQIRGTIVQGGTLTLAKAPSESTTTGTIQPGEAIQYLVTLPADSFISLYAEADNTALDPILRVYTSDGANLQFENDNASNGTLNAALEGLTTPPIGDITVLIEVRFKADDAAGNFTLRIVAESDD